MHGFFHFTVLKRPQKAEAWSDVFEANSLGNVCIQNPVGVIVFTHPGWTKYSEDCLNLNIYAPEVTVADRSTFTLKHQNPGFYPYDQRRFSSEILVFRFLIALWDSRYLEADVHRCF